ncbi:MAG: HAD family acid phosphatase [Fidelibacterota bacterium]
MFRIIYLLLCSLLFAQPGILKVGFDIDDTVLFSEPMFQYHLENKGVPINFAWINSHDKDFSVPITPTVELIHYFRSNGHEVYYITARPGDNGEILAEFLTEVLGYKVQKDIDLFFMPKDTLNGKKFTSKHRKMKELGLDLYYGDSDTDIIAALKAGVHPVRVVRNQKSIKQYGANYFGNTNKGNTAKNPFDANDLKLFYDKSVGIFGESIYPIIWNGPNEK